MNIYCDNLTDLIAICAGLVKEGVMFSTYVDSDSGKFHIECEGGY